LGFGLTFLRFLLSTSSHHNVTKYFGSGAGCFLTVMEAGLCRLGSFGFRFIFSLAIVSVWSNVINPSFFPCRQPPSSSHPPPPSTCLKKKKKFTNPTDLLLIIAIFSINIKLSNAMFLLVVW
jgi:hypothetical protein